MTNEATVLVPQPTRPAPPPASRLQIPRPWLPPGPPTSLRDTPDSRCPREEVQRYWGAAWHQWEPGPPCQPPRQAVAELPFVSPAAGDFCGVMVTWCFRHGVFQAPRQGPETPPLGPACGLLAASPTRSPLVLLDPRAARPLSYGSPSLAHPLAQAPSAFVRPALGFHPGCLPGSLL